MKEIVLVAKTKKDLNKSIIKELEAYGKEKIKISIQLSGISLFTASIKIGKNRCIVFSNSAEEFNRKLANKIKSLTKLKEAVSIEIDNSHFHGAKIRITNS